MVSLSINGTHVEVPEGSTILDAAKKLQIHIPTLCYLDLHDIKMVNKCAACRVCMVEIVGRRALAPACATPVASGMKIRTNTPRIINARRAVVELILSNHPKDCLICSRNTNCELQALAAELSIHEIAYAGEMAKHDIDTSSHALAREMDKCVLCRRCEIMCNEVQTVNVLSAAHRGFNPPYPRPSTCPLPTAPACLAASA